VSQTYLNKSIEQFSFVVQQNKEIYSPANYSDYPNKIIRKKNVIGVYDPDKKLTTLPVITAEHIFTDFTEVTDNSFEKKFNAVVKRNHDVIVTIEPFYRKFGITDSSVLSKTLNGQFDKEFNKIFNIISNVKQIVYLRWAHEMEIPIHRYGWQSQDPVKYINAYRYFMLFRKNKASNIKFVWGPAGDRGSIDYWPGEDVVDYISIAIYGLPDKNITDPNQQESFDQIFKRKSYRMRFLNKPIFITEFGVKGNHDFQSNWLKDAAKTINNNKQIFGICYFNSKDTPNAWGDIKAPDWAISKKSFMNFYNALNL
jgi:beta-mannanase